MGADVATVRAAGAGITPVAGRLLFVGRLVEKKGLLVLLDALRLLADLPGWSLHVVGDGPQRAGAERAAAGLPVTFRGALPRVELARAYASSEVVVVPSVRAASGDQDGLPVALLEAMAAGCAVVASRLAGIDAAVEDGASGLLVPPGDSPALAGALRGLLADPGRRRELGERARLRAEEFSADAVGRRYVELLHRVAGRTASAGGAGGQPGDGGHW